MSPKKKSFPRLFAIFFLLIITISAGAVPHLYITPSGAGTKSGVSWANAMAGTQLQAAINGASSGTIIWISAGVYKPGAYPSGATGTTSSRDYAFTLKNNVELYGGFAGNETLLSQRNVANNVTVLSGDIGTANIASDNCYHVIISAGNNSTAILDGFTITGGNANGPGLITFNGSSIICDYGGGMYDASSSPTVNNCSFTNNISSVSSGGMYNISSSPKLSACTFSNNSSDHGGAMENYTSSSPSISNCSFSGNTAVGSGGAILNNPGSNSAITNCSFLNNTGSVGGAINNVSANPTITSCTFLNNTASLSSGAMYNNAALPIISKCLFSGNSADHGGAIENFTAAQSIFINCVFYNNSATTTGGAVLNNASSAPTLINCTLTKNSAAGNGGCMYNSGAAPAITNCIIWGNTGGGTQGISDAASSTTVATYSIVQGGYTGNGNVNSDPVFINPSDPDGADNIFGNADDGLRLSFISPALNAGTSTGAFTTIDVTGVARPQGTGYDMGAYEGAFCPTSNRLYVDSSQAYNGNGSGWGSDAIKYLDDAIYLASQCSIVTEIWVANGTYYPRSYPTGTTGGSTSRDYAFALKNNLAIYGGFAGTETLLTQRNIASNPTILSGDIGVANDSTDNSYHVLVSLNNNSTAILDGFTIQKANANGTGSLTVSAGGSMQRANGGGLFMLSSQAVINNCTFTANTSASGSGFCSYVSSPAMTNCVFSKNTGKMILSFSFSALIQPVLTNCVFSGNSGGAIANDDNYPIITNCTFVGNTVSGNNGAAIFDSISSPTIKNTIVWGDNGLGTSQGIFNKGASVPVVSYSVVQGGYTGTGNTANDPLFVNPLSIIGTDNSWRTTDDGLRLSLLSPALNAGTATGAPATDIMGTARPQGGSYDMGAYEGAACPLSSRLYVDSSLAANGNGSSWSSAIKYLGDALYIASQCSNVTEIWVKKGTYLPTRDTTWSTTPAIARKATIDIQPA